MEKRILDEVSKLKTNNVYLKYNIGYINCNKITDVEDKENIFEYENARDYFNNVEFII